jgi:four helix bundle protein
MAFAFEKLLVYQKSVDFTDQICITTENFPRGYGFLSDQLNRASLSIAANIAEGNGRFTVTVHDPRFDLSENLKI